MSLITPIVAPEFGRPFNPQQLHIQTIDEVWRKYLQSQPAQSVPRSQREIDLIARQLNDGVRFMGGFGRIYRMPEGFRGVLHDYTIVAAYSRQLL